MKNLDEVKVGDKVINCIPFHADKVLEVTKVTKTLIICGNTRFNKQTGRIAGADRWHNACIHVPEESEFESIKQNQIVHSVVRKLHILDPVDITYEQAVKVKEIFNW